MFSKILEVMPYMKGDVHLEFDSRMEVVEVAVGLQDLLLVRVDELVDPLLPDVDLEGQLGEAVVLQAAREAVEAAGRAMVTVTAAGTTEATRIARL